MTTWQSVWFQGRNCPKPPGQTHGPSPAAGTTRTPCARTAADGPVGLAGEESQLRRGEIRKERACLRPQQYSRIKSPLLFNTGIAQTAQSPQAPARLQEAPQERRPLNRRSRPGTLRTTVPQRPPRATPANALLSPPPHHHRSGQPPAPSTYSQGPATARRQCPSPSAALARPPHGRAKIPQGAEPPGAARAARGRGRAVRAPRGPAAGTGPACGRAHRDCGGGGGVSTPPPFPRTPSKPAIGRAEGVGF